MTGAVLPFSPHVASPCRLVVCPAADLEAALQRDVAPLLVAGHTIAWVGRVADVDATGRATEALAVLLLAPQVDASAEHLAAILAEMQAARTALQDAAVEWAALRHRWRGRLAVVGLVLLALAVGGLLALLLAQAS